MTPAPIDLTAFCDPRRPIIGAPFTLRGTTYASSGRVAVRIETPGSPDDEDLFERAENARHVDRIIAAGDLVADTGLVPLPPPTPPPPTVECESCGGSGLEHECPNCECRCQVCWGAGKCLVEYAVAWSGLLIDGAVWRAVAALPGVAAAPSLSPLGHLLFRFAGGCGVLMPMSDADGRRVIDGATGRDIAGDGR